jgi:N-acetylmuramoyl-L-alanine amidase
MTTKSKANGFSIADDDVLGGAQDHFVMTTPKYLLDDAIVGVNLRWYLANSLFRRTLSGGAEKEKVIFISMHADSLHPALRGAMAYIPGASFTTGSFQKTGKVYLAHAEVRECPKVFHSREAALTAEGLSRGLADSVIASFQRSSLKVHPFAPVRDNVVRGGREWVPAVIRYNEIPTRLLLEVCNLGNDRDRALIQTRKYRQQLAEAVYEGIVDFYAAQATRSPAVLASAGAGK